MEGSKETGPSKHNRTIRHMNSQTVAVCTELRGSAADGVPGLREVDTSPILNSVVVSN